MKDIEIWKDYAKNDMYEASNLGRVRTKVLREYLKVCTASCTYPVVWMKKYKTGMVRKSVLLHRILAETHLPNPENKPFINHINGDKHDYSLSNLEWCTTQENAKHAYAMGLTKVPGLCGENHPMAKLDSNDVIDILKTYLICQFTFNKIARFYNIDPAMAENVCKGKFWKPEYKRFCDLYNDGERIINRKVYDRVY